MKFVAKLSPPVTWRATKRPLPGLQAWQISGSRCLPESERGAQLACATRAFKQSLDEECHQSL